MTSGQSGDIITNRKSSQKKQRKRRQNKCANIKEVKVKPTRKLIVQQMAPSTGQDFGYGRFIPSIANVL